MPTPFSQASVQQLLDAKTAEEVEQILTDHGYEIGDDPTGEAPAPEGEEPEEPEEPKSPFGASDPFEDRAKVAKRAARKTGFSFGNEDDGEID